MKMFDAGKPRMVGLPYGENIAEKFNRLRMVHERHRRQTTDTTAVPLAEHNVVTFG